MKIRELTDAEYIADDRLATPEYFEKLKSMTDEEFAQYVEELKKCEDSSLSQ